MENEVLMSGFRERRDGNLEYRFTEYGKRFSVYGSSVEECLRKRSEKQKQLSLKFGMGAVSLSDYYSCWEQARLGVVRDSTISSQRAQFRTISAVPARGGNFGDLLLEDISTEDIRALQRMLSEQHCTNTVNQYVTLVKSILHAALMERRILYSPADGVRQLRRTEEEARKTIHRALTRRETRIFFKVAENSRYYNLYRFLLNTGCRCGEAAAITEEDIRGKTVLIRCTVTRSVSGAVTMGAETKSSSGARTIPLRPEALQAIKDQIKKNSDDNSPCRNGCIFSSPQGLLLSASTVDADIRRICEDCGLSPFTSHAFRDTFATRAIESGMNPKTLQELLGHSDFGITMNLYVHCMDNTKRREIDRIAMD